MMFPPHAQHRRLQQMQQQNCSDAACPRLPAREPRPCKLSVSLPVEAALAAIFQELHTMTELTS